MTQLARISVGPATLAAATRSQHLTFTLDGDTFALGIERIREVIEFAGMTRIPKAPPTCPGVINLRGAVVPVIDLAHRFGRAATRAARRTCVIVVEALADDQVLPVGLLVDSVSEAVEVDLGEIDARPAFGTGLRPEFVSGMLKLAGEFVVVLELKTVLALDELEGLVTDHATRASTRRSAQRD